jgi:hypothetical protein
MQGSDRGILQGAIPAFTAETEKSHKNAPLLDSRTISNLGLRNHEATHIRKDTRNKHEQANLSVSCTTSLSLHSILMLRFTVTKETQYIYVNFKVLTDFPLQKHA